MTVYSRSLRAASALRFAPSRAIRNLRSRRHAVHRWKDWAARELVARPIWIHGASVGELLAAEPVTRRLKRSLPNTPIIYTHGSDSVEGWYDRLSADRTDYIPLDDDASLEVVFECLNPLAIVFSRGDAWPGVVAHAAAAGVPMGMFSATFSERSVRLAWPGRRVLGSMFRRLDFVTASTEADARKLARLGVELPRITVAGDTRVDQVLERDIDLSVVRGVDPQRFTVVAGSTEPDDESIVVALAKTVDESSQLIVVPHDPATPGVHRLERVLRRSGIQPTVSSDLNILGGVVVFARTGMLASLYAAADVAYVGGGFRKQRLHSVLEPASLAVPAILGPHWSAFPEAAALVASGGAFPLGGPNAGSQAAAHVSELRGDPERAWRAGLAARATLHPGAADAAAETILALIREKAPRPEAAAL